MMGAHRGRSRHLDPTRVVTWPFVLVTSVDAGLLRDVGIMLVPIVPLFIEGPLDAGEFGIGLTVAVFAVAAIAARPLVGRIADRFGRRRLMIGGALLAAAGELGAPGRRRRCRRCSSSAASWASARRRCSSARPR